MVAVVAGQDGDGAGAGIAEVVAGHGGPVHQVIGDGDVLLVGRVGQADREGDGGVAALGRWARIAVGNRNRRRVVVGDAGVAGVVQDAGAPVSAPPAS